MTDHHLYIDGAFTAGHAADMLDVIDPSEWDR
jgi:hypothetical protein